MLLLLFLFCWFAAIQTKSRLDVCIIVAFIVAVVMVVAIVVTVMACFSLSFGLGMGLFPFLLCL
jgi:hypothetical protein